MTPIGHVPTNFILFLNFSSTVVISVLKCVKSSYTPHPEPELSAVHLSLESWDSPRSGEWFLTFSSGREHVRYSPWSTCNGCVMPRPLKISLVHCTAYLFYLFLIPSSLTMLSTLFYQNSICQDNSPEIRPWISSIKSFGKLILFENYGLFRRDMSSRRVRK